MKKYLKNILFMVISALFIFTGFAFAMDMGSGDMKGMDMKGMNMDNSNEMKMTASPSAISKTSVAKKSSVKKSKKVSKNDVTEAKIEGNPDEIVQCPVMGTKIKKKEAVSVLAFKGKVYYVCCAECVDKFKKNPEAYIK
jgi:YHS domain-containing protein